ncbi:MAG: hypothetical protein JRF61_10310 [Deltaproteobacteria bacterium]|jgi:hypothetical protein|nr:hypothetical protein [Deltaproteobacteria bacterium]
MMQGLIPARSAYLVILSLFCLQVVGCAHGSGRTEKKELTNDPLPAAFDVVLERIAESETNLHSFSAYGSEAERVAAYRHLTRSIKKAIEAEILQDADFPYFRILDFWLREGGDNPDQRYAFSPIRGGEPYRIWGSVGSARRVEIQLYAGVPWDGTGRSAGFLPFEEIEIAEDGSFEIFVTSDERKGAWLHNPDEANTLFVRHIFDEWSEADTGEAHIDRLGREGERLPAETAAQLAERFRAMADTLEKTVLSWPQFVNRHYVEAFGPNVMPDLIDTYSLGGVEGRWMANGYFELPPGKALVIKAWPTAADYQAIQLCDMWFASLEYGNRVSSLNTTQSLLSPDGAYYYVISREDPGHANWLDTGELDRGVFLMRYDGVQAQIPSSQHPSAELVDLGELEERIPGFTRVSESERAEVRAARRRHLQIRSGR